LFAIYFRIFRGFIAILKKRLPPSFDPWTYHVGCEYSIY
jgi:hypothetical protein